jgi:hypothetical protein
MLFWLKERPICEDFSRGYLFSKLTFYGNAYNGLYKKCEEMGILDDVMKRINELNI